MAANAVPRGPCHVHHAPCGEIALQRARCFFLDLGPRRLGDRGKLAVQIIHGLGSPLSEPMPREPSRDGERGGRGGAAGAAAWQAAAPRARPAVRLSRNVADGHEEQRAGDGAAEIQQPVVIARRPADEHVRQHLLDRPRRAGIAHEIRPELALPGLAEGHVVAQDLRSPCRPRRSWSARCAPRSA